MYFCIPLARTPSIQTEEFFRRDEKRLRTGEWRKLQKGTIYGMWQRTHLRYLRGYDTAKLTTTALLTRRKRSEDSSVKTVTAACAGVYDLTLSFYQISVCVCVCVCVCVSGFGGLEVACWPLVPKFAGSNPAEAVGFFRAKKSSARLPSDGK